MIRDRNIEWIKKRIYIPAYNFSTYVLLEHTHDLLITGGQAASDGLQVLPESGVIGKTTPGNVIATGSGQRNIIFTNLVLRSATMGGAPLVQVGSSPLVGALMTVANREEVRHYFMLPYDINRSRQIEFYLYLTKPVEVTSLTPRLRYGLFNNGTALADVTTELDSPIPAISDATGYTLIRSGAGIIRANKLSPENLFMGLRMNIAAQTGIDIIYLLGVEIVYTPRKTA